MKTNFKRLSSMMLVLAMIFTLSAFGVYTVSATTTNTPVTTANTEANLGKLITNKNNVVVTNHGVNVVVTTTGEDDTITVTAISNRRSSAGDIVIVYEGGQVVIPYKVEYTAPATVDGDDKYVTTLGTIVKWSTKLYPVIDYYSETISIVGLGGEEGEVLYALKANTSDDKKNKYYPVYGWGAIDISKLIPKKAGGKAVTVAFRLGDDADSVAYIEIPARPAAPGKTDVAYKDEVLTSSKAGVEVQFGINAGWVEIWSEKIENEGEDNEKITVTNTLDIHADIFPNGGAGLVRYSPTDTSFASAGTKLAIKAMPKAPKLTVETKAYKIGPNDDKGKPTSVDMDIIKGVKSATSHQVLLPVPLELYEEDDDTANAKAGDIKTFGTSDKYEKSSWINIPYNTTSKVAFVRELKAAIKAASYMLDDEGKVTTKADDADEIIDFTALSYKSTADGKSYIVPVRTASTEKAAASAILNLEIPKDMFKAPAVTAVIADKAITKAAEAEGVAETIVITLTNGTFDATEGADEGNFTIAAITTGTDLTITEAVVSEDGTKVTLTIAGDVKNAAFAKTDIKVLIAKAAVLDEDGKPVAADLVDVTGSEAGKVTIEITKAAE